MRFYAQVRSERAEKGQGGNKELDVEILCQTTETKQNNVVARVRLHATEDGRVIMRLYPTYEGYESLHSGEYLLPEMYSIRNGKRQKGEVINIHGCTRVRCICGGACHR